MELKEGDITESGWEILSVYRKPEYKMRKRIKMVEDIDNIAKKGEMGYLYSENRFFWIEIDGADGIIWRPREGEFKYVKTKNEK